MNRLVLALAIAITITSTTTKAVGDDAMARTFGNSSKNSDTAKWCSMLSDPALAEGFSTKEAALAALKNAIEKRVEANPDREYGATIVKCGGEYRVEPIATGKENGLNRAKNNLVNSQTGEKESEIACGMHYHPSGSLTGSIGDLVSSNNNNFDEYIVVRNPEGKGLSPDIGKLSPNGTPSIVRLNGTVEVESPNMEKLIAELSNDPRCKGVDIAQKIADNKQPNGQLPSDVVHAPACKPTKAIPVGQFSDISLDGVSDQAPPTSPVANPAPAAQSYTKDNRALKQWASQQLEGAYQYASGIAAEAGVGAEYQSAVAPVMSQGRAAISSIPDQQTVTVPTQVQPQ